MKDFSEVKNAVMDFTDASVKSFSNFDERLSQIEVFLRRPRFDYSGDTVKSQETKAFEVYAKSGDDHELKALSVNVDAQGGFTVTGEMAGGVFSTLHDRSPMRTVARVVETSSDAIEFLVNTDLAAASWVGEKDAREETTAPSFRKQRFSVHELHAQPRCTQKLLDDSSINIADWLQENVAESFAITEGAAFITGNGVDRPKGLLDYPTSSADDATRDWGTLQYVAGGHASLVNDPDKLLDLIYKLKAGYRAGATWLMARSTVNVIRQLKQDSRYIWAPGIEAGQPDRLLGFPVVEMEDMPAIAADEFPIAFGNFQRGYVVVNRTGLRVLRDPYTAKPNILFDSTIRVGGGILDSNAVKLLKISTS